MKFLKSILTMTALGLSTCSMVNAAQVEMPKPQAVEKVNLEKYTGQWYEIAHLPMFYQRHCASNTKAQYTLNPDNTMTVFNSCRKADGKLMSATGVAYSQNSGNSELKVSFLPKGLRWIPFTKGDYWVLRLDPDYKVALVGDPSRKFLWILSREPQLDDATYQSYLDTAKSFGYDLKPLIKTVQQP